MREMYNERFYQNFPTFEKWLSALGRKPFKVYLPLRFELEARAAGWNIITYADSLAVY
jgi:hypothetical protein